MRMRIFGQRAYYCTSLPPEPADMSVNVQCVSKGLILRHCRVQFVKRDTLLEIERECQLRWERDGVFQMDAPQVSMLVTYTQNNVQTQPAL